MDLFSLIRNLNPFKVKTGMRPRAAHEVPLLTAMASRVIDMEDPTMASGSSGTPSTVERAEEHVQEGLAYEIPHVETATTTEVVQEVVHKEEVTATEPLVNKRRKQMRRKRVNEEAEANASPKALGKDHASGPAHTADEIPTEDVSTTEVNVQLSMRSLNSGKSTSPSVGGSPGVQHEPGTAGGYRFATKAQIKKLDEEIRSLRTVETEVHGLRNRTQNLETLLEAKVDMKKAAEAKSVDLAGELESLRAQFSDLQVNNHQLSQQVSTLQAQVTGKERIKAAFEEFKKSEDEKVEQRCAEMDARLDAPSIDFDEDLYPHMLTAIAGRRWVIGHGLRLAIMKCAESMELRQAFADVVSAGIVKGMSEGLKYGVEHEEAKLDLAAIEAYDPETEAKYIAALTALRDLKYPFGVQSDRSLVRPRGGAAGGCHRGQQKPSDGIPISAPTDAPQGLAILLADAAIQTEASEDEASSRLLRSKSLPPMYNLDWP
ncbi:hypothetical protein Tco_0265779 [Tanacetum coccineum]